MNTVKSWTLSLIVAAAAVAAACAPAAMAAPAAHAHDEATPAQLHLDHGRKWATDAPLRQGMGKVRALVAPKVPLAHAGKMDPAQYAALASAVEVQVGYIVANCKLPPEADAVLHVVIGELMNGAAAMSGKTAGARPEEGLLRVVAAVNDYGRTFEHPGFQAIPTGH
jgi:hypothetical protein